jgi:signal transduction histidine kinase
VSDRPSTPASEVGLDHGLESGVLVFRWAAWIWMAVVATVERSHLTHRLPAIALIAAALAVTFAASILRSVRPGFSVHPIAVVVELCVGAGLLIGNSLVEDGHQSQSLGSAWPLAGPLAAGIAFGPQVGAGAGIALGVARGVAGLLGGPHVATISVVSSSVLYAFGGGVGGWVAARLRRSARTAALLAESESSLAVARQREDLARALHDGVLQTLSVVQRRSTDAELAALARRQELELRGYLFGIPNDDSLLVSLRDVARRHEEVTGTRVTVVCPDDIDSVDSDLVDALRGAVTEALTNAAKHGEARTAVVYIEQTDSSVFVSVKDDGLGFDPGSITEGIGLTRSIRGRMADVRGRVEVVSTKGSGAEVRLWGP